MKTKVILTILFLFFIVSNINAQSVVSFENNKNLLYEEILSPDSFNLPAKSTIEDVFVLDSSIVIKYRSTFNDTTKYYYKYDSKKNIIEEIIYTTIRNATSGFTSAKYQYS